MIKLFSKKYWITLISVPVVGTGIILACAGSDDLNEYGSSSYTPEAFVDSSYRPFFYSMWYYYGVGFDEAHDTRFNATNINEWSAYLNNSVPRTELEYLLTIPEATAIDSMAGWFTGKVKSLPRSVQSYQLFSNKKNNKIVAFINYLQLAKKCEAFAVNNLQYAWDYESKKNKTQNINISQINTALLQGFNNTKDAFLKERYWFQLERSYFFNDSPQTAIDLFQNNEKQFPKNTMYYRTMAYAAGAHWKLKNYSKANYYYSKVYDGCTELKTVAHYSFSPQEEADWKAALALCANNDEKATLWQMLGTFHADEKRSIQEIYALNPRSEKLDLLLARAINKEEENCSLGDDQSTREPDQTKKDTVNKELISLVSRIAQAGNTSKPYMWHMAAGFLSMLNRDNQKAATSYAAAEKNLPKQKLPQMQLRLLKLVNTIASSPQVDSKLENAVLNDIEWLRSMNPNEPSTFRFTGAYDWVKRSMANRYMNKKDSLKSVCFVNYPAFYANDKNVEAMKTFLDKPNKTPYEQLCTKLYIMDKNDLVEFQAIRQTYNDNLKEAIAKLESTGQTATLPGNPFNGRLQDCHDCDHAAPQKIKYSKVELLRKMKELENNIKANKDVHRNALLLGNAFYNITHYGNARAFYECDVIGRYYYAPYEIYSEVRSYLLNMDLATKYYSMALNAAQNDEQKARAHFMLAKCERNQWYNETKYNEDNNAQIDFKAWNGFKTLKQQYANTQYYKEVIKECGYFRTYINKGTASR
jgi:hypothetical protein